MPLKAAVLMLLTESPITTEVSGANSNADSPIVTTEFGIVTEVSKVP